MNYLKNEYLKKIEKAKIRKSNAEIKLYKLELEEIYENERHPRNYIELVD